MSTLEKLVEQAGDTPFKQVLIERGFPIPISLLEFLKFQLKYIVPLTLNDGQLTLLAYIKLHGEDCVNKYMADGHSRSTKSVDNYLCELRKLGILTKENKLHPGLALTEDPTRFIHFFNVA